ncbi:MAG: hypothetical protein BGO29_03095 [Bacteroidales bacterium 36-12]|jgi:hypothetical protein|nr:MAG: hypothetical protein BGO29_03095 [Bacteroidales bacterium 36-12]
MKKIYITTLLFSAIITVQAEEESKKVSLTLGSDFVSSYVWRGAYQTGYSVQPSLGLEAGGLSLSAWGSSDIASVGFKEVDFTLGYSIAGLSIAITDYWWMGEGHQNYFRYQSKTSDHLFEGTIAYTLPLEKFPLSISCNTMFGGADYKLSGDRAYSTYIELVYPFTISDTELDVSVGMTPQDGLYASKTALVNVGIGVSKTLKISESYSLPVFGRVMANPHSEDIYYVFGFSL